MSSERDAALQSIERFLSSAARPVLIEAGEAELPLDPGSYSVEVTAGSLRIHAWTTDRSYSRRIAGIKSARPGRLELRITRLGRPDGVLTIFDAGHARNQEIRRRGHREQYREHFRRMLARQYPDHKIAELSTAPDLEHSLSPAYPRAMLRQGTRAIAAIGAAPDALDIDGVLTFGLIWLDYLRRRERRLSIPTLAIFVPEDRSKNVALRLRWLDPTVAGYSLFVTSASGEMQVDPSDWGNLVTKLGPPSTHEPEITGAEAHLEMLVRRSIRSLDAALLPEPVYRQAPAIAAADRGIADLVALDISSRLTVLELKASQDIHLPLQALDYWMRVKWHLDRGDFERLGYFPGIELSHGPPLLYLVAPSLDFHPTTDTLLRFLSPSISVTRLGLGANWKWTLKVVLRQDRNEHSSATA